MENTDNLNFRGKFRQYDVDGRSYLYRIGDSVTYNGKKYVATKATQNLIPGTLDGNTVWKELGSKDNFYYTDNVPTSPSVGDRWFRPSVGIMYTYVEENNNQFWIEFVGGSSSLIFTRGVTGACYSSDIFDYYIGVSYDGTAGIYLPPNPDNGKIVIVKDESGHAGDPYKYIVIRGATASDTIDRESSATININNATLQFVYRNGWRII
jgi:hypothetical protein